MNRRLLNIRLAWLFFSMALILVLASIYFIYAASTTSKSGMREILGAQCIKEFEAVGIKASIRPQDHAIVSYQPAVDLMQDRVNASSMVIGRCAGYRLVEFCAGSGCSKPGVLFVMESL